jgi:hypothetical protein
VSEEFSAIAGLLYALLSGEKMVTKTEISLSLPTNAQDLLNTYLRAYPQLEQFYAENKLNFCISFPVMPFLSYDATTGTIKVANIKMPQIDNNGAQLISLDNRSGYVFQLYQAETLVQGSTNYTSTSIKGVNGAGNLGNAFSMMGIFIKVADANCTFTMQVSPEGWLSAPTTWYDVIGCWYDEGTGKGVSSVTVNAGSAYYIPIKSIPIGYWFRIKTVVAGGGKDASVYLYLMGCI